jgi:hypothetical protein
MTEMVEGVSQFADPNVGVQNILATLCTTLDYFEP